MKEESQYVDGYISVGTGLIDKWLDKYRCKKCGHLGKVTIITNVPLNLICESCEREERIDSILGSI